MPGTFFGLSIAASGLSAQKRAMDVLGYNIAHANDPTYKRQRIVMSEGEVLAQSQEASGSVGTAFGSGVQSGDIERVRDSLLDNRLRAANQAAANWDYRSQMMSQLESVLGEPSDTGLQNDLDNFWASWQKVAVTPESLPVRSTLLEDASALCQRIQFVYSQMSDARTDLSKAAQERVDSVNTIAAQIGSLNQQMATMDTGQIPTNDLLNRRDALVEQLSKTVAITQHGEGTNDFLVLIGGRVLVQGTLVNQVTTSTDANDRQVVQWADDGEEVAAQGGELRAILDLRDSVIPGYTSQLDNLASSLVQNVNALHSTGKNLAGQDGGDFFKSGSTAENIALDDQIVGHAERVAASQTGAVGDGDIALAIGALKDAGVSNGLTIDQVYQNLVADIGAASAAADQQATAQDLSVQQYVTQQQSVSGVSLDEEMTNMIKFQQAYNASARVITVMDEMLTTLTQNVGVGGR